MLNLSKEQYDSENLKDKFSYQEMISLNDSNDCYVLEGKEDHGIMWKIKKLAFAAFFFLGSLCSKDCKISFQKHWREFKSGRDIQLVSVTSSIFEERDIKTLFPEEEKEAVDAKIRVTSFNCGGLPYNRDFWAARIVNALYSEREVEESSDMAKLAKVQDVALRALCGKPKEGDEVIDKDIKGIISDANNQPWKDKRIKRLAQSTEENEKMGNLNPDGSPVKHFVVAKDQIKKVADDIAKETKEAPVYGWKALSSKVEKYRQEMFAKYMQQFAVEEGSDIIALQECGGYVSSPAELKKRLPKGYSVKLSDGKKRAAGGDGIAFNTERFEFKKKLDIGKDGKGNERGIAVKLYDKITQKTVVVASAHLAGCNPFHDKKGDGTAGTTLFANMLDAMDKAKADIQIVAMDSNVTATHPRLKELPKHGYKLDCEHHVYPTCVNPLSILNTRLDWIAVKSKDGKGTIENAQIKGVDKMELSDHKPIAAMVA